MLIFPPGSRRVGGLGGGCRRYRDRLLDLQLTCLILFLTGLVPPGSTAFACYSCDGGPICSNPDAGVAKLCEPGVTTCFKFGLNLNSQQMTRGCAPKSLTDFFQKHIRGVTHDDGEEGNVFHCSGHPFRRWFRRICDHYEESLMLPPGLAHAHTNGGIQLCQESLCNDGPSPKWSFVTGNWDGGRCPARSIADILFVAEHVLSIRHDPDYARDAETIRKCCTRTPHPSEEEDDEDDDDIRILNLIRKWRNKEKNRRYAYLIDGVIAHMIAIVITDLLFGRRRR